MLNTCTICKEEKEVSEFLKDKQASKGYRNQCKSCLRERAKEQRVWEHRKEGYNKAMRKYRSTMIGAISTSFTARQQYCRKNEHIPFEITRDYCIALMESQQGLCALTGVELIPKSGPTSPSLDKKDPKLGYVEGNVQWVTKKANTMKQDCSMEELIHFCKTVIELSC